MGIGAVQKGKRLRRPGLRPALTRPPGPARRRGPPCSLPPWLTFARRGLWEQQDHLGRDDENARAIVNGRSTSSIAEVRVAEIVDGEVVVHEWLKLAILLLFRLARMETVELGPFEYADKIR